MFSSFPCAGTRGGGRRPGPIGRHHGGIRGGSRIPSTTEARSIRLPEQPKAKSYGIDFVEGGDEERIGVRNCDSPRGRGGARSEFRPPKWPRDGKSYCGDQLYVRAGSETRATGRG